MSDLTTVYTKILASLDEDCLAQGIPTVSQHIADLTAANAQLTADKATLQTKIDNAKAALG